MILLYVHKEFKLLPFKRNCTVIENEEIMIGHTGGIADLECLEV